MTMINSELLKEAIADAKAVRNTAVLNAKHALEEAFAPRFHAMFAEKLKEESGEDVGAGVPVEEVSAPNQVSGPGGEAKGPHTKDVSQGQPKKVSDASTHGRTVAVGGSDGAKGSSAPAKPQGIEETTEIELEEESGITSEDLDEIIRELEAEVGADAEGEEPVAPVAPEAPAVDPAAAAPAPAPVADPAAMAAPAPAPAPVAMGEPGDEAQPAPAPAVPGEDEVEEEIDLNALLEALTEEEEVSEGKLPPWLKKDGEDEEDDDKEELDEIANEGVPTNVGGQDASGGVKGYPTAPKDASKAQIATGTNHTVGGKGNIGSGAFGGKPTNEVAALAQENEDLKEALNEHVKAIKYLQGQINEVNLLNAKLLYTTKLFKEFNLDNKQKMRVVETFDLLKNVREVKLTYAGMCEALNFGASKKPLAPKASGQKRITESYAGKPVASTKPSAEIISESKDLANRFKKLAGIKAKKQ